MSHSQIEKYSQCTWKSTIKHFLREFFKPEIQSFAQCIEYLECSLTYIIFTFYIVGLIVIGTESQTTIYHK